VKKSGLKVWETKPFNKRIAEKEKYFQKNFKLN
jgi:hypothetical protein